jgi:hypothetical protein
VPFSIPAKVSVAPIKPADRLANRPIDRRAVYRFPYHARFSWEWEEPACGRHIAPGPVGYACLSAYEVLCMQCLACGKALPTDPRFERSPIICQECARDISLPMAPDYPDNSDRGCEQ